MSAFEAELAEQMRSAVRAAKAAELAGDDLLALAMRDRLADLASIAARHQVPA